MNSARQALAAICSIVFLAALSVSCTFFTPGSGPSVTREYDYSGFTSVEIGKDVTAEVSPSAAYQVAVTLPESLVNHLNVSMSGGTLRVGLDTYFSSGSRPKAVITLPDLVNLSVTGGAMVRANGFKSSHEMSIACRGGGTVDTDIECGRLQLSVLGGGRMTGRAVFTDAAVLASGGSHVTLSGDGNSITDLEASGGSRADLHDVSVENADATLTGGSSASLWVNKTLNVDLDGSGLNYKGDPQIAKKVLRNFAQLTHDR